ncbi:GYF domain-containing protein [Cryptosporidium felis]|nr:GYF domain-containing protein [Cryptosporidium felis]
MSQARNLQENASKNLYFQEVTSNNVYPIKLLLRLYRPLDIPKSLFKLEASEQRSRFRDKLAVSNGEVLSHFDKRHRNWNFGTGNNRKLGMPDHIHSQRDLRGGNLWRNNVQNSGYRTSNEVIKDSQESGETDSVRILSGMRLDGNKNVHSFMDLEKDMSSIEKILNNRFEKGSLESEQFIRNKLVMALEGIDGRTANLGNEGSNNSRGNKYVEKMNLDGDKIVDLIQVNPKDSFQGGFYNVSLYTGDPRSQKRNIAKGGFRESSSAVTGSQHPLVGRKFDNQLIKGYPGISFEVEPELDVFDEPIWLYKETGSNVVTGPFSTKQMSVLWKGYAFTHNTLFKMTSNFIWGPINIYYPEVKSTFTFIPDIESISGRHTEDPFNNGNEEKINSEDISSIISEINELQLGVENSISAPKIINIEKRQENPQKNEPVETESFLEKKLISIPENNEADVSSRENSKEGSNEDPKEDSKTLDESSQQKQVPVKTAWKSTGDEPGAKKQVVNFEEILREEEVSSREKLREEMSSRKKAEKYGMASSRDSIPKGWRKTSPGNSEVALEGLRDLETSKDVQTKYSPPQLFITSPLGGSHHYASNGNKWKGWGNKVGENSSRIAGNSNFDNDGDFCPIQADKNSQKGFWEMFNSEPKQQFSAWSSNCNNSRSQAENGFDIQINKAIDNSNSNVFGPGIINEVNETTNNSDKPVLGQKSKRKKGRRVDSSLLAFGIRSDRPRNLNYDLD